MNSPVSYSSLYGSQVARWVSWWQARSAFQKYFPLTMVGIYWTTLLGLRGFRSDHIWVGIIWATLYYLGPLVQSLYRFLLPLILLGVVYDSQRFYSDYIRAAVHVWEPYAFDKLLFGISTASGILTPNEWFQLHTHPVLDFVTGFAYLFFITIFVGICAYFSFWKSRVGSATVMPAEFKQRAHWMMWAFLFLNILGFSTYYWFPAAPPWYVALHGLGPAKMDTMASVAGCIRFDQLLGTHFFGEMYSRSADVFGAIPSLHIAYPLLAVYFAFALGSARIFACLFYLVMCFSAVYLNHHYILDIMWGSAYALLVGWFLDRKVRPAFYSAKIR
ncbi:phosphatase PAP2 family protein [Bdellovibrionota bacterium FG-2]